MNPGFKSIFLKQGICNRAFVIRHVTAGEQTFGVCDGTAVPSGDDIDPYPAHVIRIPHSDIAERVEHELRHIPYVLRTGGGKILQFDPAETVGIIEIPPAFSPRASRVVLSISVTRGLEILMLSDIKRIVHCIILVRTHDIGFFSVYDGRVAQHRFVQFFEFMPISGPVPDGCTVQFRFPRRFYRYYIVPYGQYTVRLLQLPIWPSG